MNASSIEHFLHTQVQAWNRGDKEGFFAAYRTAAPEGLLDRVRGPWAAGRRLACAGGHVGPTERQDRDRRGRLIINGNEAACHNRNKVRGSSLAIDTIEIYRFEGGA
jgi:hypothetical protein